jgi:hypothetical protein
MDRSLVMAVFAAADARFDPCGATAFVRRLAGEIGFESLPWSLTR